uniref:dolichyl-diphosphooligosaccharide--protein glycotransferase n=1 Tax=Sinocyclocheilus rhinocerous TaxID=307959 RepID=A0A673J786_9TELE
MAEHHTASDCKHKASSNAGGSVSGNGRPSSPAGCGGSGGGLSGGLTQPAGWQSLLSFTILFLAWLAGFSSRLFAVYPGLMVTAGLIHYILNLLHVTVHIRDVCVFLAPVFSGLTSISTFLLTRELWNQGAGLLAACFIAIVPGYISRSVAGSFDNEGIAIFALQFTYYLWVKSVKTGSVFWAIGCCLSYFYMVSAWGGYVFIINLIPLHVFVLLLMQRFSRRLYIAYSTFYIVGLVLSMQIPFVGFQPIRTSEHMAAAGVFALLQAYAFLQYLKDRLTRQEFQTLFFLGVSLAAGVVFLTVIYLTYTGYIAPWSGRFYSLWDTGYAKIHIPIIASVSEHQPTTWVSFFFDLHILVCTFPAGLWFCIKNINDERVFVALYAISAVYFAGVMVRLMLTLTPVVCMLSAIAFSSVFEHYLGDDMKRENPPAEDSSDEDDKRNQGNLYDKVSERTKVRLRILWWIKRCVLSLPYCNTCMVSEFDYFTPQGEFRVDKAGSPTLLNCLMYKMSYYRFGEMQLDFRTPPGFDRTRNAEIGNKDIRLKHLEEAFTSEHWLVRIYRVKKQENRQALDHKLRNIAAKQKYTSKKTAKRKRGYIKNKLVLKKGKKLNKKSV